MTAPGSGGGRDWRHTAECRYEDPQLFFPDSSDWTGIAVAKTICARCPVRRDCGDYADTEHIDHGIYGGRTPAERDARQRQQQREAEHRQRLVTLEAEAAAWRGRQLGYL